MSGRGIAAALAIAVAGSIASPPAAGSAPSRSTAAMRVAAAAERLLKLQAEQGLGILGARARRASATALRELETAMHAVGVPAAPSELHESAAILAILGAEYRSWALRPATRDNARKLGERAEELVWEARRVARLSLDRASRGAVLAARAEEASALAQRIARLLLWRRWGLGGESAANLLAAAQADFEAGLRELGAASENDATAAAELQLAQNQASFLTASVHRAGQGSADAHALEFAAKASDNAQESLERLAALYERSP